MQPGGGKALLQHGQPIDMIGMTVRDEDVFKVQLLAFDFGDDWWHQIDVVAIHDEIPTGRYPRITTRIGESPPQYPDFDEDEDGDDA